MRPNIAFQRYITQEWKSNPTSTPYPDKTSACFDCNICLDFAHEPVVTLCGHLYCWPCIYKWVQSQPSGQFPQCPVCKTETSMETMVPLYGRGQSLSEPDETTFIPPRPPAWSLSPHGSYPDLHNFQNSYNNYEGDSESSMFNLNCLPPHPVVGMLGEMVCARVFGNTGALYSRPNSYHSAGSSSPRLRRLELEADMSLNRVSIFLFCCFLLCLFLF
ncbi:putative E3 ubiquitin ligase [Handroanthus impetiginosus]|uniref:E3 ubiquitin-protein ligase RMA n=1 Tax=Handroanthus impetiginosus TaxID=429701 RepID=A0A2G9HPG2_9LAMI|nr:putative E3 ubiquitin ligase [Handroanthus impetiginosus]